ncbi:hypothetical protein GSI_14276 [Ganoderma sinense ZZ0214-1]|uniref:F-box domain-containing protein n=1 Tax=Ganoderma sinense ZZ0214-1 TaxID=1077348 RepID=A0A2G8RSN4_9APHY|nr:hypothetical protein GSI_14276 [Ganoderma sinense ZZ0214-1]
MSSHIRLPPELCDQTIDHLWDDPDALRACSLTCKDWLPSSRYHLFRNVRLRHSDDVTRFRALLDSNPTIAPCVRKLSLSAEYNCGGAAREDDAWVNSAAELFSVLQHVTTLALARVRWHALSGRTRAAFTGLFKSVRQLFLFEVAFDTSRDVVAFLSAFPALRELYFHAVSWATDSPAPFELEDGSDAPLDTTSKIPRMQLSYLFLDPTSSPTLVTEWLLRRPGSHALQTIQLCWRELGSTKAVGALLRASGSALESLHVEFPSPPSPSSPSSPSHLDMDALRDDLSLAHNPQLRALHFGGLDVRAAQQGTRRLFPWVWVTAMLAQVHSRHLQELSFMLEIADVRDLRALDWARIDAALGREEFRGLVVVFRVCVSCERPRAGVEMEKEVRREIGERLGEFRGRGTLCVSCI